MRALILGGGGFVGAHLSKRLVDGGWRVTCLLRKPFDPAVLQRLTGDRGQLDIVSGDASDAKLLGSLVVSADAIFAMTGPASSTEIPNDPQLALHAYLSPTITLLQLLRAQKSQARVVFPGSRLQYGQTNGGPVDESRRMAPLSWYGICKTFEENLALSYGHLHDLNVCWLRISPIFGPSQHAAGRSLGIVGHFWECALRQKEIRLFGDGSQLRDILYIDDLTEALELAATRHHARGEVFNIGGPRPISLRAVADEIVDLLKRGRVVHVPWPPDIARLETGDYWADTSKASRILGWHPTTELRDGLKYLLSP